MKRIELLAVPLLLAAAGTVHAQAYECRVPKGPIAVPRIAPDGPVRKMPVSGYTLALSWSPEFCRMAGDTDSFQCSGRSGRFGLVLHGLWPEGGNGRWPQWCPALRRPSPEIIRQNLCMTPSAQLLAHEWAKHGACMVRKPETYFKVSRILWNSLVLPDLDRLSRREGLNAGMIRDAFAAAFPALKPEMVGLRLNDRGWLSEVRLCYGKDFKPTRCTASQFGPRDSARAKIWRGL